MTDPYATPKVPTVKLPHQKYSTYRILVALLDGSGTFWQLCERANINVETDSKESVAREAFNSLLMSHHIRMVGITYHLNAATRAALVPPVPYMGQVAGPRYRGPNQAMPVKIYRREVRV